MYAPIGNKTYGGIVKVGVQLERNFTWIRVQLKRNSTS